MKKLVLLLALLTTALAGCARPSAEELASLDYGDIPLDYEAIARSYFAATLKDPYSVVYENFSAPHEYWVSMVGKGVIYGYLTCVTYNAKNSYGAYVGYTRDALIIRNGTVVQYVKKANWLGRDICHDD
jgi:hypothetical protein